LVRRQRPCDRDRLADAREAEVPLLTKDEERRTENEDYGKRREVSNEHDVTPPTRLDQRHRTSLRQTDERRLA